MCSLIDCLEKISAPIVCFYIDYSKEAEDDFLGGLSPFIIDLDIGQKRKIRRYLPYIT